MVHSKQRRKLWMMASAIIAMLFVAIVSSWAKAPVEEITIEPKGMNVLVGEKGHFTAVVSPADADKSLTWESSEPEYFTVDENGTVTGIKPITTCPPSYITAVDASGKVVAKAYVSVVEDKKIASNK